MLVREEKNDAPITPECHRQLAQDAYLRAQLFKKENHPAEACKAFKTTIDYLLLIPYIDKSNPDYQMLSFCYEQLATFYLEDKNLILACDTFNLSIDACSEIAGKNDEDDDKQRRILIRLYQKLAEAEYQRGDLNKAMVALDNAIYFVKDIRRANSQDSELSFEILEQLEDIRNDRVSTPMEISKEPVETSSFKFIELPHSRKRKDTENSEEETTVENNENQIPTSLPNHDSWFTRLTKWMRPCYAAKTPFESREKINDEDAQKLFRKN